MDPQRTNLTPSSRLPLIFGALAAAAAAVGLYLWFRAPPPVAVPAAPVAAVAPVEEAPSTGPAPTVPADRLQALLASLSANPAWRRWITAGDLVRRFAVAVDNLAEGVSPRKPLEPLAPERPFAVARSGGRQVIAAESYQRYDALADAVASVDAQAALRAYRELHPVLEAAWRGLGYPKGSLDQVVGKALRRVEQAPVREGEVAVVPATRGVMWEFADRKLEELGTVEKHLLRMGPRNTRLLQAKARELSAALGASAPPAR